VNAYICMHPFLLPRFFQTQSCAQNCGKYCLQFWFSGQ
jgi:hypothetical protein